MTMVYLMNAEGTSRYKIGFAKDPNVRLRELQTGCPYPLKIVAASNGDRDRERKLHARFSDYRQCGEWFDLPGDVLPDVQRAVLTYTDFHPGEDEWELVRDFDGRHHSGLVCCLNAVFVHKKQKGYVLLAVPAHNCTDMSGAIRLAQDCAGNAVNVVFVYAGRYPDCAYFNKGDSWQVRDDWQARLLNNLPFTYANTL